MLAMPVRAFCPDLTRRSDGQGLDEHGGSMRQIDVPMSSAEQAFLYFCPICGIELSVSNYETPGSDYFCPYCSTDQRPSRVLNI
jgi:DNA-directed RNA polymerase subunit RPC12/RpoP